MLPAWGQSRSLLKIAIVHSYYSGRQTSGENVVVDAQAAALRGEGLDVRIIGAHTDELETKANYKVRSAITVATGMGASPLAELEEFRPDIVHVHNLFPNWGTKWLEKWRGPLVTTIHNFRPVCAAGTLFRDGEVCTLCPDQGTVEAFRHACYRESKLATLPLAIRNRRGVAGDKLISRADRVVLLSGRARALYTRFGLTGDTVEVITNFVDDVGFPQASAPGEGWVYVGRLSAEKGIVNLLRHWPAGEKLDIYGDGPMRSMVEAAVGPNVRYHGSVNHDAIPMILAAARGLVFPSEWAEGLPLVYAESLASGRPVVAKSGNSAADDVERANTGHVFDSWEELEGALRKVASDIGPLALRARQHYERTFTQRIWLDSTLALYASLGNGKGESHA
jgi:glycosyltransferase involved in cell wall biosynthesis